MDTVNYVIKKIEDLVNIPSPSGFTKKVIEYVKEEAEGFGYQTEYLYKGGLIITVPGQNDNVLGLSAHVDTLGAMVRSITKEGMLNIMQVGSMTMESIEGAYCKIHTRDGRVYDGTILSKSPSVHSYDNAKELSRVERNMEVRIDEVIKSKDDVLDLGIETGDYISYDPQFQYLENGFIKSRHLDDKASVGILLGLLKELSSKKALPKRTIKIVISNYEEVGVGASYIPEDIHEFIAVDMGAIGDDLMGSEYKVSICAKDSGAPYDYDITTKFIQIAKEKKIDYVIDIFPHYGSDASAALRGGNDIKAALIGPGIHASHGMERTHMKALQNTLDILSAYIEE
ncbi:putative aminopeptidase FrvX [Mobilisporobacter senegalensis]|uniref:Putative aminopeptidase FrvX n=1 Tax=Mobilisporobacter senegalensis TaxID=1329262 RepID=A0A3N1XT82_9FIRM|nr:M42 family metallopeptidase [Mobilisporobacter senegalensis]ROR29371.1 putative aminopeptidase FrvX [Mobilisporobacter senegalensis]